MKKKHMLQCCFIILNWPSDPKASETWSSTPKASSAGANSSASCHQVGWASLKQKGWRVAEEKKSENMKVILGYPWIIWKMRGILQTIADTLLLLLWNRAAFSVILVQWLVLLEFLDFTNKHFLGFAGFGEAFVPIGLCLSRFPTWSITWISARFGGWGGAGNSPDCLLWKGYQPIHEMGNLRPNYIPFILHHILTLASINR